MSVVQYFKLYACHALVVSCMLIFVLHIYDTEDLIYKDAHGSSWKGVISYETWFFDTKSTSVSADQVKDASDFK